MKRGGKRSKLQGLAGCGPRRMGGDPAPVQGCVLQSLVWLWGPWHPGFPGAKAGQLRPRVWMPPSQGAEQVDQAAHRPQMLATVRKNESTARDTANTGATGSALCGAGAMWCLNCSFSATDIHPARAAPNTPLGQALPVKPLLSFLGLWLGTGRNFWTIAGFTPALPQGPFSSSAPHPAPVSRPPRQGQRGPYLGTPGGCRAPPGWPLLGRTCCWGWDRAGNGCASLGPLQGQGSSGSRWTRVSRASSPAALPEKGQDTAQGPAGRGGGGTRGRSEKPCDLGEWSWLCPSGAPTFGPGLTLRAQHPAEPVGLGGTSTRPVTTLTFSPRSELPEPSKLSFQLPCGNPRVP